MSVAVELLLVTTVPYATLMDEGMAQIAMVKVRFLRSGVDILQPESHQVRYCLATSNAVP